MFDLKKEILDSHEAILTIEIDDKAERRAIQKAARRLSREVNIPGFRKGKAPPNVIMRMFGEEPVLQEAADDLMKDLYPKVLEEADIEPYGPGQIEAISMSPMRVTVRVPLMPEVKLGDYESLRLEPESADVTEEDVATVLKNIREDHAILEPVDRKGAEGDAMLLSLIEGEVDGVYIVHEHDVEVVLDPEQEFIMPGVVEELMGLRAGDEKSFVLTLPEELEDEDLAGKEATFTVSVEQVYDRVLPELDDALASTVGNYETLAELKEELRQAMREHKAADVKERYRDALIHALIADAELHYPPLIIEEELDNMLDSMEDNVVQSYDIDWETFLEQVGTTEEALREDLRTEAVENIERGLILAEFAEATGVEVSEEEVRAELGEVLKDRGIDNPALLEGFKVDSKTGHDLRNRLFGRKTLEKLERLAQGLPLEEPEPEPEAELDDEVQEERETASAASAEVPAVDTDADEVHTDSA